MSHPPNNVPPTERLPSLRLQDSSLVWTTDYQASFAQSTALCQHFTLNSRGTPDSPDYCQSSTYKTIVIMRSLNCHMLEQVWPTVVAHGPGALSQKQKDAIRLWKFVVQKLPDEYRPTATSASMMRGSMYLDTDLSPNFATLAQQPDVDLTEPFRTAGLVPREFELDPDKAYTALHGKKVPYDLARLLVTLGLLSTIQPAMKLTSNDGRTPADRLRIDLDSATLQEFDTWYKFHEDQLSGQATATAPQQEGSMSEYELVE